MRKRGRKEKILFGPQFLMSEAGTKNTTLVP